MTGALSVFDSPWYCFTFEFHYLAVIAGCSIVPRFMELMAARDFVRFNRPLVNVGTKWKIYIESISCIYLVPPLPPIT